MGAHATVRLRFADAKTASAVARALAVDNPHSYVRQHLEGPTVVARMKGPTLPSLRETLDDYLRCVSAAATTASAARGRRAR